MALAAAERILAALRVPLQVRDHARVIGASIGVASGGTGVQADELLRNAVLARYAAAATGDRVQRASYHRATSSRWPTAAGSSSP